MRCSAHLSILSNEVWMSPQGLIHGKTACEEANRGGAGEETPKKSSESAISPSVNIASQRGWLGQIPIPLVPRHGMRDATTLAQRSMVPSPGANLGPVTERSGATFQPVENWMWLCLKFHRIGTDDADSDDADACSMPQNKYGINWPGIP